MGPRSLAGAVDVQNRATPEPGRELTSPCRSWPLIALHTKPNGFMATTPRSAQITGRHGRLVPDKLGHATDFSRDDLAGRDWAEHIAVPIGFQSPPRLAHYILDHAHIIVTGYGVEVCEHLTAVGLVAVAVWRVGEQQIIDRQFWGDEPRIAAIKRDTALVKYCLHWTPSKRVSGGWKLRLDSEHRVRCGRKPHPRRFRPSTAMTRAKGAGLK